MAVSGVWAVKPAATLRGPSGKLSLRPLCTAPLAVDADKAPRVRVYDSATIHYVERIYTLTNTRQRTRLSCYFQVTYDGKPYIGIIKKLVLLEPRPGAPSGSAAPGAARFAICDIYKYSRPLENRDTGDLLRAHIYHGDPSRTFAHRDYAVHLQSIDTKLTVLELEGAPGVKTLYACPCGSRSGMGAVA